MAASPNRTRKASARAPRKNTRRSGFVFWRTKKGSKKLKPASAIRLLAPLFVVVVLGSGSLYSLHYSAAQKPVRPVSLTAMSHVVESLRRQPVSRPTPTPASTPAPTATPSPTTAPTPAPSTPPPVATAKTAPGKPAGSLAPPAQTPAPTPAPTQSPSGSGGSSLPPATGSYTSNNWAGYFMNSASYTAVSGAWTATSPTGDGTDTSADATWIGIGGINVQDLIQVGTENTVSASGQVSAAAFYELLPAAPIYPATLTVRPGDAMSAFIHETTPGQWTVSITDSTTGKTFSTSVAYTSGHGSAEWIQEDPSYSNGSLVPFDNFGIASFTGASASAGGSIFTLLSGNANAVALVDGSNNVLATPSIVGNDGASFNVSRN